VTRIAIGVVGLGAISQSVHLPLIRRNAHVFELVALVDLSASRVKDFAERYSVAQSGRFLSVDAVAEAVEAGHLKLDAVILATTGSHAHDVARLIRAGIRVLAEKPLAYSLAELENLDSEATRLGIDPDDFIRVGYMKEYDQAAVRAKELLADVTLRAITVEVLHPMDHYQLEFARLASPSDDIPPAVLKDVTSRNTEIVNQAVGSSAPDELRTLYTNVVLGSIVHDIGLLRYLVGGLGDVHSAEHWGSKLPGSLHFRGQLATGKTPWSIDWHYIDEYPDYRETLTFHHETGTISLTFGVPYVTNLPTTLSVTERDPDLGIRVTESRWMQQEAFENELLALAALVRGERPAGASIAESVRDVQVGQRMIHALALSKGLTLDPSVEAVT
jgi:predicted dehydrogenase